MPTFASELGPFWGRWAALWPVSALDRGPGLEKLVFGFNLAGQGRRGPGGNDGKVKLVAVKRVWGAATKVVFGAVVGFACQPLRAAPPACHVNHGRRDEAAILRRSARMWTALHDASAVGWYLTQAQAQVPIRTWQDQPQSPKVSLLPLSDVGWARKTALMAQ
ncbi:hypothetical protein AUP68_06911 [Ilyonectria robusta]